MKKVLIVMDTRRVSGPAKNLFAFLNEQARSAQPEYEYEMVLFNYESSPSEFVRAASALPFRTWHVAAQSRRSGSILKEYLSIVRQSKPDIVQTHGYKTNVLACISKFLIGHAWVSFFHGWTQETLTVRLYHSLDRLTLLAANYVVTVSKDQAQKVRGFGVRCHSVIPNAIQVQDIEMIEPDLELRARLGIDRETRILLVLGRLSGEKGQRYSIEALKQLNAERRLYHLLIAGEGPDETSLRSVAAEVNDSLTFLGHVNNPIALLKSVDLLVVPSLSEGMPNVILEAFAAKIPVVATKVGGIPDMVKHKITGILVPPKDSAALALGITQSFTEHEQCVNNAQSEVQNNYTVEKRSLMITALYAQLLNGEKSFDAKPKLA